MKKLLFLAILLLFYAAEGVEAATRYVDGSLVSDCITGNYSIANRNCAGSDGDAWNTLAEGISNTSTADTLWIRAGIYAERINNTVPAGNSDSARTIIAGYPGDAKPILRPTTIPVVNLLGDDTKFITLKNLEFNGQSRTSGIHIVLTSTDGSDSIGGATYITLEEVDIKNCTVGTTCVGWAMYAKDGVVGFPAFNRFINSTITNTTSHGLYVTNNDNVIEGNTFSNIDKWAVQFYNGDLGTARSIKRVTFKRNVIYDSGPTNSGGIVFGAAAGGVIVHNNLIYNMVGSGVQFNGGAGDNKVYNNTITGNSVGVYVSSTVSSGNELKNNLILGNTTNVEGGAYLTLTTNLTTGTIGDYVNDAAANDYTLKAATAAINGGTAVAGYVYNGSAPDIGAFETFVFSSGSV